MLGLPAMTLSSRSYQFASAAGAALLLTLWALVASDRGRRPWVMAAFGLAAGVMLLTRPMTVAFLPGLGLATVVVLQWSRRVVLHLAIATLMALAVAGPWWFRSRDQLRDYLFSYGYGSDATDYGGQNVLARALNRLGAGLGDLRPLFVLLGLVTTALVLVHLVRWRRSGRSLREWTGARREIAGMLLVIGVGYAALFSTANLGVWFELPLELVGLAAVISLAGLVGGAGMARLGVAAVTLAAISFAVSLTDRGGEYDLGEPRGVVQGLLFGGLYDQARDVVVADARFGSNDASVRDAASEEWAEVSRDLVGRLDDRTTGQDAPVVTLTGSTQLVNANTLMLAHELRGEDRLWYEVPDTRAPDALLEQYLTTERGTSPRTMVILRPRSERLPQDRESDRLRSLALDRGWEMVESLPWPDGGTAEILVHPDDVGAD